MSVAEEVGEGDVRGDAGVCVVGRGVAGGGLVTSGMV